MCVAPQLKWGLGPLKNWWTICY